MITVKKLRLLVVLITMSLATFSQTGTNNKVHCFPDSVAKQIAIDLVRGDSAKVELAKTNILVNQLEEKTKSNDRLVSMYVNKVSNYASQIDLYRKKETEYHTIVFGLEKDIVRVKKANKYFRIAVSGLLVTTVLGFTMR